MKKYYFVEDKKSINLAVDFLKVKEKVLIYKTVSFTLEKDKLTRNSYLRLELPSENVQQGEWEDLPISWKLLLALIFRYFDKSNLSKQNEIFQNIKKLFTQNYKKYVS